MKNQGLTKNDLTKWLLLIIAVSLIIIHLVLVIKSEENDLLSGSILLWTTVSYLIWEKRKNLILKSDVFSSFLGVFIISLVLIKSSQLVGEDIFLRISPFLSLLGVALLGCGWKQLKQFSHELWLFGFLAFPWESIYLFVDLSLLTAKFSAFILWLLGFEVSRQGVLVILPTGSIEVYNGCSGLRQMVQLLGIGLIFLALIPTNLKQKILVSITAILIGFMVNGIRVALMAILIALGNEDGFKYWHTGDGSLIFSLIAVVSFALISISLSQNKTRPFQI